MSIIILYTDLSLTIFQKQPLRHAIHNNIMILYIIQIDSSNMYTNMFSFNNAFIQILIFGNYTSGKL